MRKSTLYLAGVLILVGVQLLLLIIHPGIAARKLRPAMEEKIQMVRLLGLTDLCLFTEARHTRHLSQADLFSAFQDHPMGFDRFPSGSLTTPPVLPGRGKQ